MELSCHGRITMPTQGGGHGARGISPSAPHLEPVAELHAVQLIRSMLGNANSHAHAKVELVAWSIANAGTEIEERWTAGLVESAVGPREQPVMEGEAFELEGADNGGGVVVRPPQHMVDAEVVMNRRTGVIIVAAQRDPFG